MSCRSEWGHTRDAVLFLVQSLNPLTSYTELHNLPVCLHFSSGQMLLWKEKAAITAKRCCITHGDTAASQFKFTDLSMKVNLRAAKTARADIGVNMHEVVLSCTHKLATQGQAQAVFLRSRSCAGLADLLSLWHSCIREESSALE